MPPSFRDAGVARYSGTAARLIAHEVPVLARPAVSGHRLIVTRTTVAFRKRLAAGYLRILALPGERRDRRSPHHLPVLYAFRCALPLLQAALDAVLGVSSAFSIAAANAAAASGWITPDCALRPQTRSFSVPSGQVYNPIDGCEKPAPSPWTGRSGPTAREAGGRSSQSHNHAVTMHWNQSWRAIVSRRVDTAVLGRAH